jgi:hypothetical protein
MEVGSEQRKIGILRFDDDLLGAIDVFAAADMSSLTRLIKYDER